MNADTGSRQRDPFRWRSMIVLTVVGVIALVGLQLYRAALGLALGGGLFAVNLLFLYETGRSLVRHRASSKPKVAVALSSAGRMTFLAVALSLIALFLGRDAVLGACGGLLIAQVNLHVPVPGR